MLRTLSSQVVGALLGLALTAGPVFAQITTGTLAGTVRDATGATMPGVVVTATSESRNTLVATVTTNTDGDYVIPNVTADTYTVELKISGFKPVKRSGVSVSGGGRVVIPVITLEVGGASETVDVVASAPSIQAQSGERSFTITTTELANLPIAGRNFASFATLVPGVSGTARIGGGGQNNVMMDGAVTVDTGGNQQLLQLNPDAIAEVRVLTSGYQAEFGRGSGLQITSVTKSGTNKFRGSAYDLSQRSGWNTVPWANQKNGTAPGVSKSDTFGYTIGGPVGRPAGRNKLFFFYAHEYRPTTSGGATLQVKLPTLAELGGDFTQSTDTSGNRVTLKAPFSNGIVPTNTNCGSTAAPMPCANILAWWKNTIGATPNISQADVIAQKLGYNYQTTSPIITDLLQQPTIRMDYQFSSSVRFSGKYAGQRTRRQIAPGSLPGFTDTLSNRPVVHTASATVNYTLNPTMFLEGTWGMGSNYLGAPPVSPFSDRRNATGGLANFPFLFNQGGVPITPGYNRDVLIATGAPFYDSGTNRMFLPPIFAFGNAGAPPTLSFPEFITESYTNDLSISLTKVAGKHTVKSGFYFMHGYKPQNRGGPSATGGTTGDQQAFGGRISFAQDSSNPLDTNYGYANALLGIFSTYNQQSQYREGIYVYDNVEAYLQDNWKVNRHLTLDYGMRFVHMQPQYDTNGQFSNFFTDKWSPAAAPLLYVPGCAVAASQANPCPASQQQAMRPDTNQLLGPNTNFAIGTVVPNTGNLANGIIQAGQAGTSKYDYVWPALAFAPRTGAAYDVTGNQRVVVRGGYGLFFDRPNGNQVLNMIGNPPFVQSPVLRWSTLSAVANSTGGGITTTGTGLLTTYEYNNKIPRSHQWNAGVQMALPWSSSLDVSYVGQHAAAQLTNIDINSVDLGAAFLPQNQNPILAPTTNGSNAVSPDLMRAWRGLGTIQQNTGFGWNTFHSIQVAFTRRFQHGFSFGLNETYTVSSTQNAPPRIEHYVDSTGQLNWRLSADYPVAQDLFGNAAFAKHQLRGNFVWSIPKIHSEKSAWRAVGLVANDWQLSGVVTASTGTPYSVGFSYNTAGASVNLTGSPQINAQPYVLQPNNLGSGCSSNQYSQFNNSIGAVSGGVASPIFRAPTGPAVVPANVSVTGASYSDGPATGLESRPNYLTGCPSAITDLALSRSFRFGGRRTAQLRLDAFNVFNTVVFTGRNTTLALNSPTNPTLRTSQFTADGTLDPARLTPAQAGFGAVTSAAALRTIQVQVRFGF